MLLRPIDNWLSPAPDPARVEWLGRTTYAHRGLHGPGVPENSAAAFAGAIEAGLGIECDIQRSADDVAMVFHDWELGRLTAVKGPVGDLSGDEIGRVAALENGEFVPTLSALLRQVDGRVPLLIEIKSRDRMPVTPICLAVKTALTHYRGQHAIMSFDPRIVRWFHRQSPATVTGLVVTQEHDRGVQGRLKRHLALWHARPDFLAYDIRDLPSRFASGQRARGLPLLTWTVRSPELASRAARHADAPIAEGAGLV